MMKTILLILLTIFLGNNIYGQDIDSLTLSKLKLNFSVPDMPAFKSLGTEPSNLLKPSTPMAFAVTLSEIYQDRKFAIPKSIAVEISPALLLNAKKGPVALKDYAKNGVANSFRISLGTSVDTVRSRSARNLALGFRINFINNGDPSTDTQYHDQMSALLREFMNNVSVKTLVNFAQKKGIDTAKIDWEDLIFGDLAMKAEFDAYLAQSDESSQSVFLRGLKKLREDYKKRHWNDTKLDVAAAIVATSSDSLFKNIRYNRAEFWVTWALKCGKNAQFLIGANGKSAKNLADTVKATSSKNYFNLSVPARFVIGTNRVKGFLEAQYSYLGYLKQNKYFINIGAEINLIDGVWINLSGGFDENATLKASKLLANFNLKLTLPENFKLF